MYYVAMASVWVNVCINVKQERISSSNGCVCNLTGTEICLDKYKNMFVTEMNRQINLFKHNQVFMAYATEIKSTQLNAAPLWLG